jgi:hypothetical protein
LAGVMVGGRITTVTANAVGKAAVVEGDLLPIGRYVTGRALTWKMGRRSIWLVAVLTIT